MKNLTEILGIDKEYVYLKDGIYIKGMLSDKVIAVLNNSITIRSHGVGSIRFSSRRLKRIPPVIMGGFDININYCGFTDLTLKTSCPRLLAMDLPLRTVDLTFFDIEVENSVVINLDDNKDLTDLTLTGDIYVLSLMACTNLKPLQGDFNVTGDIRLTEGMSIDLIPKRLHSKIRWQDDI